jgi:uncharacterized protein (TIGR04222 family)
MFTLRGPEFLALFVGLFIVVYVVVESLISSYELRLPSDTRIRDPYAIAYLRGQSRELLRIVAMSLVLRRLLAVEGKTFLTVNNAEVNRVQVPVEKEVLRLCQQPYSAPGLVAASGFTAAADTYHRDLVSRGLIADENVRHRRWMYISAGIALLVTIAVIKILVALATGHSNVLFLMLLLVAAIALLVRRARSHRTAAGSAALVNLRTLFQSLWRARRGGKKLEDPSEAALLAAVFGVYTLAGFGRIAWARLFPSKSKSNSCAGSGCGSSGGCGGGGSGGGCGGCGS